MLKEWKGASRWDQGVHRRWFTDEEMDLIVWYRDAHICDFQLCYDKKGDQHAIIWSENELLRHQRVDSGEKRPGNPKSTPVMNDSDRRIADNVAFEFSERAKRLETALFDLVIGTIHELSTNRAKND